MDANTTSLHDRLGLFGDETALIGLGGELCSRGQLGETVCRATGFIQNYWRGDVGGMLTLLPDHPSSLPFQVSAIGCSAVTVANPSLTPPEIEDLIVEAGVTAIVTQSPTPSILAMAEKYDLGLIELQPIPDEHFADFDLVSRRAARNPNNGTEFRPSLVLTTSGSSGKPKIVPITETALLASARNISRSLELGPTDLNVHMLPMFHIGAVLDLFIVPLFSGGRICLAHPISTENLVHAIRETGPTWIQAVPTMLKALLRNHAPDELASLGESLRFIRSVSADLAPGVQEQVEDMMKVPVIQMYGMTETAGQICTNGLADGERKPGSVGKPFGCKVRILDQHGNDVLVNQQGEVCVSGETVFAGYTNLVKASSFHGEWFRTGDLGHIDPDGFLFLGGRLGDIVNRGGEKFSALEVEQKLLEHTGITHGVAFSIPHESLGEDIGALVVASHHSKLNESDVRSFLANRLAAHKIPRQIKFTDVLPTLGSGKIDKKACRDQFLDKLPSDADNKAKSETGTAIASVWSDVLNGLEPGRNDDFFDSGGDSLAAHTFILSLEERLGVTLPVNILFEAPTFSELEKIVTGLMNGTGPGHDQPQEQVYRAVRAATSAWSGHRAKDDSLIIGLRNIGSKKPFFFCANGLQDYLRLSQAMDPDRPFYTMRSLSLLPEKTPDNILKLARIYADEITNLQPEGSISLGGHCGGANVADAIADSLLARGRQVDRLIIIDRVFRGVSAVPATIIWTEKSDYSHHSGASLFVAPEHGVHRLFPLGANVHKIEANHSGLMHSDAIREIAAIIDEELNVQPTRYDNQIEKIETARLALAERRKLYKAGLSVSGSRFCAPDDFAKFCVRVTNQSTVEWLPTRESGIRLMAKWERPNGKSYLSTFCDGELNHTVSPGETVVVNMRVSTRKHRTPLKVVVDLVDDGVAWFSWNGNPVAKRWVLPWLP